MAEGRYEDAISGYIKAAEYLQTAIKYEKNPVRDRQACRAAWATLTLRACAAGHAQDDQDKVP